MKTLINKVNPQIRITAPEVEVYGKYYYIKNARLGCLQESWTLVEEETCKESLQVEPTEGIRGKKEEIPSMELILSGLKDTFIENKNIVDYDDSNPFISIYWEDLVRAIKKILI